MRDLCLREKGRTVLGTVLSCDKELDLMTRKAQLEEHREKFRDLMEIEGYDDEDAFLEDVALDSIQPGICIRPDCDYTTSVEPDSYAGWCPECEKNTVRSPLALLVMI